jgi:hypothetical protein
MMSVGNVATILLALAMTVVAVVRSRSLPAQLPMRYDLDGRPSTWAGRRGVWFYPILTLVLIAVISLDGEKWAPLSLFFAAMLLVQMLRTLAIADGRTDRLQPWFLPVFTFGVIGLVLLIALT